MPKGDGTGPMGQGLGTGKVMGRCKGQGRRGSAFTDGSGENCICLSCGDKIPHKPGQPCNQEICPKCGNTMIKH